MAKTFSSFCVALVFLALLTVAQFVICSAHSPLNQLPAQREILHLKTTLRVGPVDRFNCSPDGRWLAVTQSKRTTAVWNLQTGRLQCQTPESTYEVNARSWSPEPGVLMVVSWDHGLKSALGLAKSELQLWDAETCKSRLV